MYPASAASAAVGGTTFSWYLRPKNNMKGQRDTSRTYCKDSSHLSVSGQYRKYWLVGCLGFNGPLRQYFSLYRAVSQREGLVGWLFWV